jgi:pimeloyl-ACP methyl ester carboxylesterase
MSQKIPLSRPGETIAYNDREGNSQLIIATPEMGNTSAVSLHLTPLLMTAGYQVVTIDLRGIWASSPGRTDLSDEAVSAELLALIAELQSGPAIRMGNSLSYASAVVAATAEPEQVLGLVLLGSFVRKPTLKR